MISLVRTSHGLVVALAALAAAACTQPQPPQPAVPSASAPEDVPALREAFAGAFLIGAALNDAQFSEQDARGVPIVKKHFNTITAENALKWMHVHPRLGRYAFDATDRFVDFGTRNAMVIIGHTLVWHNQTPRWVFEDAAGRPVSRDTLLARLRDHIHTVVGRYKGRIRGWDVVNEALNEDGSYRRSPWYEIIGEDYIAKAFQYAREADPAAELYYNDYSLENAPKRNGAVALVKRLQAEGIRIDGVGLQGHNKLDWPAPAQQDSTIAAFAALGVKVMITELDVDVLPRPAQGELQIDARFVRTDALDPYTTGLPDSVAQAQARQYADLFAVYLRHRASISRITFWGVTDGDSWLNGWPVPGRTNHPLLFDRSGRAKPAFDAVIRVSRQANTVP